MKNFLRNNMWLIIVAVIIALTVIYLVFSYHSKWTAVILILMFVVLGRFLYLGFTNQLNQVKSGVTLVVREIIIGFIVAVISYFTIPGLNEKILNKADIISKGIKDIITIQENNSTRLDKIQEQIEKLATAQDRSKEELIIENKELREKLKKESIASISTELQNKVDRLFSEFKYSEARKEIDNFLNKNENFKRDLAKLHFQKALTYEAEINYLKAKEELEMAVVLNKNNPVILEQYGVIVYKLGEYDKALEYFQKSLKLNLKILGKKNNPSIARNYNNIALALGSKGEYNKAIELYKKALEICLKVFNDKNHPKIATIYNNIGSVWNSKGEYGKAIQYFQKALKINLKALGNEHPSIAIDYNNIGSVWNSKENIIKRLNFMQGH